MTEHEALERIAHLENERWSAERSVTELRHENRQLQERITKLELGLDYPRPGGTFVKETRGFPHDHILIGKYHDAHITDTHSWEWSEQARRAGLAVGQYAQLDSREWACLPGRVRAESWWHLCAQVGLTEAVARICYYHPEEGQPSAVAETKGIGEHQ